MIVVRPRVVLDLPVSFVLQALTVSLRRLISPAFFVSSCLLASSCPVSFVMQPLTSAWRRLISSSNCFVSEWRLREPTCLSSSSCALSLLPDWRCQDCHTELSGVPYGVPGMVAFAPRSRTLSWGVRTVTRDSHVCSVSGAHFCCSQLRLRVCVSDMSVTSIASSSTTARCRVTHDNDGRRTAEQQN